MFTPMPLSRSLIQVWIARSMLDSLETPVNWCFLGDAMPTSSSHSTLWDIKAGKLLAQTEVDVSFKVTAFGAEGTSVLQLLQSDGKNAEYHTLPLPTTSCPSTTIHRSHQSSLPMVFVPILNEQKSALPVVTSGRYHYQDSGWILDGQDGRVLWMLPDRRRWSIDSYEKKVAIACHWKSCNFGIFR